MILFAGALLLTPGFFTDAVGFALLTPPVRRWIFIELHKRVHVARFEAGSQPRPDPQPDIIDADYEDLDASKTSSGKPSGWTRH